MIPPEMIGRHIFVRHPDNDLAWAPARQVCYSCGDVRYAEGHIMCLKTTEELARKRPPANESIAAILLTTEVHSLACEGLTMFKMGHLGCQCVCHTPPSEGRYVKAE